MALIHNSPANVQLASHQDVEYWTRRLGASYEELTAAVNAVGTATVDVEAYLRASQESMGSYVARMRARLDQIEIQLEQLTDERKRVVGFLEGFAQLQRNQRPPLNALALALSATGEPKQSSTEYSNTLRYYMSALGTDLKSDAGGGFGMPHVVVHEAIPTTSSPSPVLDVVYRLLQDGRRRSIHEILSFLEVRGVPLKGSNPTALLSTMLSRDSRFDASRREGWGLAAT